MDLGSIVERKNETWYKVGQEVISHSKKDNGKFFIEIGSADWDTLFPLARNGWRGIIVEPIDYLINNIQRHSNVKYENIAVMDYNGKTEIRYYDQEFGDRFDSSVQGGTIRGISSTNFFLNHFNGEPQWKEYERIKEVDCVTLDRLVDNHDIKQIDYLKLDAETVDYRILLNYSWKIKPTFIKVETMHWKKLEKYLSINIKDRIKDLLYGLGYIVYFEIDDLYAIR